MANILLESWLTYTRNIKLVLLFSIPFLISFLIPLLAYMPSYITAGGVFIRTSNFTPFSMAVIVLGFFFSLLFLSFSFVAISLLVKSEKTHNAIASRVIAETEKYTGKVFLVLIFYTFLLFTALVIGHFTGMQGVLLALVGILAFLLVFYAPTAIVIDNKRIGVAIKESVKLVVRAPQYLLLWLALLILVLTFLDFVFISILGNNSAYVVLFINSVFVAPYFVIFQAHAYMKRFPLLKH